MALTTRDVNVEDVDTPISEKNVLKSRLRPRPPKAALSDEQQIINDDDDDDDDPDFVHEIQENLIDQALQDPPSPWTRGEGSITPLGEKDAEEILNQTLSLLQFDDNSEQASVSIIPLDQSTEELEGEQPFKEECGSDEEEEEDEGAETYLNSPLLNQENQHIVDALAPPPANHQPPQRTKEGSAFSFCSALFNCN